MFGGARVAVVVPAYNEAGRIAATLRSVPAFVDHVLVVDDASRDGTAFVAAAEPRAGLEVIVHARNRGVGAAITTGYRRALAIGADVIAVMAGDGQMDPEDLPALVRPVVMGEVDYAKGNRLSWPGLEKLMPLSRRIGNRVLTWITRRTAGYPRLIDSQCGYTVASCELLGALDLERVWPGYGYPNDLLARVGALRARVRDVPVRPVYGPGWKSGIRPWMLFYPFVYVLVRSLFVRLAGPRLGGRPRKPTPVGIVLTPGPEARQRPRSRGGIPPANAPELQNECA